MLPSGRPAGLRNRCGKPAHSDHGLQPGSPGLQPIRRHSDPLCPVMPEPHTSRPSGFTCVRERGHAPPPKQHTMRTGPWRHEQTCTNPVHCPIPKRNNAPEWCKTFYSGPPALMPSRPIPDLPDSCSPLHRLSPAQTRPVSGSVQLRPIHPVHRAHPGRSLGPMPLIAFLGQEDLQQIVQEGPPQRGGLQPCRIIHHQPAFHGLAQLHPDHGWQQARALLEQWRVLRSGAARSA